MYIVYFLQSGFKTRLHPRFHGIISFSLEKQSDTLTSEDGAFIAKYCL